MKTKREAVKQWQALAVSTEAELEAIFTASGYHEVKRVSNGVLCVIFKFNFTFGLVAGLELDGYSRRYCYEHEEDAKTALNQWDGKDHPSGPWIKCKGAGLDLLNPLIGSLVSTVRADMEIEKCR